MGQAKNKRSIFFAAHPICAFCGGREHATTIEHCPPRAVFNGRHWPEGFEFPACEACNSGTSNEDVMIAFLSRLDPREGIGNEDGKLAGYMKNANAQFPGLIQNMMPTATEARRLNSDLGIKPQPGQTHQDVSPVKIPIEMHKAVCVFGRKLSKAIYYLHAERPFPNEGCLLLNWFANADILREGKSALFEALKDIAGDTPLLQRGGKYLNEQFDYKVSISQDNASYLVQARFRNAFGFAVLGSTTSGYLEGIITKLQEQNSREGPLTVIQSPSLSLSF
jgi:hypothetical protein